MLLRIGVSLSLLALLIVAPTSARSIHAAGGEVEHLGLVDPDTGRWFLRAPSGDVVPFYYGDPGDEPFLGDWDCDGVDTPGLYRRSDGYVYLRNSNDAGIADVRFFFGDPGDLPLAGDFDGDGCDTVALYRPGEGRIYVINRLGSDDRGLGAAETDYQLGEPGDLPFAGDFDGDGIDTFGALRPGSGVVYLRNRHAAGPADVVFTFGDPGDRPVVGSWGAPHDTVGVYRPAGSAFYLRHAHRSGAADEAVAWGKPGWLPVAGRVAAAPPAPPPATAASATPSAPDDGDASRAERPAAAMPTPRFAPPPPVPEAAPPTNTPTDATVYVGEDLQAAADANPPGATITVKAGVHRLQQVVPKDGQTFEGEPGAVLSGARLLGGFAVAGDAWVVAGQDQQGLVHGECDNLPDGADYSGCRHPEDLFFDGVPLRQVTDRADLRPGHWYFDYAAHRIYVADDPAGHRVEVSVAPYAFAAWRPGMGDDYASDVTIRGLVIEKYASPAQHGAVHAGGAADGNPGQGLSTGWAVLDSEIRLNHGAGVRIGEAARVSGSYIHRNGQLGISARGTDVEVSGNEIAHNNTAGFAVGWEAGGVKATFTTGLVVRHNYVHDNHGFGLWTDIDNVDTRYEGNTVADNGGAGIFHEISYAAEILDNDVTGNGALTHEWFYGAGILVAHSSGVEVAGNLVSGNADGIAGIQQARGGGAYGPYRLDTLWVHDNVVELTGGFHGVGQDVGDRSVFARDIRFERNEYVLDGPDARFAWMDRTITLAEWQAHGQDAPGL